VGFEGEVGEVGGGQGQKGPGSHLGGKKRPQVKKTQELAGTWVAVTTAYTVSEAMTRRGGVQGRVKKKS